ncbi:hypothetical protein NOV72_04995 [Caballeronia novacaledonica]|uniref:Uncharacterized protein n=1 Tax=Caballeronia novacaledonica TaxID=1544861 RepID=A0A2U3IC63_9BURK|nr:hypothetical protein [Caballeronia novacaledonica]SPB17792.1 hypothetical protein NOV72_04995 [Caballeronia novacaledonica]
MPSMLEFALRNPGLIFLPAIGGVAAVFVVQMKTRYLNCGVFFGSRGKPLVADTSDGPPPLRARGRVIFRGRVGRQSSRTRHK